MTIDVSSFFDDYALRARLYPAFLVVLPLLITAVIVWELPITQRLWLLAAALGVPFLLSNLVRSRGRRLERRLTAHWGGLPTTIALRLDSPGGSLTRARRRTLLESATGITLPTAEDENRDRVSADETYVLATRALIQRVNQQRDRFPRVHEENIHYGFRRNLLALKPVALAALAVSGVGDAVSILAGGKVGAAVGSLVVDAFMLTCWVMLITGAWVREAADIYAERLFETLESPSWNQSV